MQIERPTLALRQEGPDRVPVERRSTLEGRFHLD